MGTSKRILIVEDDEDIAGPLEHTIRRLGYESAGVLSTGEKTVAKAPRICPDVIIMDVLLGGWMTGIEANNRFPLTKPT